MVFDTTVTPPTWVHIGLVHGGVVCSEFYKALDFPEIFSRTEDCEVLDFIRSIMDGEDYRGIQTPICRPEISIRFIQTPGTTTTTTRTIVITA